ncbi:MAG TPA: hypothetical protein VME20_10250 [Acidimicrobiales bacterium]|nr:hypothetical protein [Acidimicrobiales bacterium]
MTIRDVDGFRFDLATTLTRQSGDVNIHPLWSASSLSDHLLREAVSRPTL